MDSITEEFVAKINATTKKAHIQKRKEKLADMLLEVESGAWSRGEYSQLVQEWSLLGTSIEENATVKSETLGIWAFLVETAECLSLHARRGQPLDKHVREVQRAFRAVLKGSAGMFYLYEVHRINKTPPFVGCFGFVVEYLEELYSRNREALLEFQA